MDGYDESVMVAALPTSGSYSTLELPHVTIVYAGEIKDLKSSDFNQLGKDVAHLAAITPVFSCEVLGQEVFGGGTDKEVEAYTLNPNRHLLSMRYFLERWNRSQYIGYRPHTTIGPKGTRLEPQPTRIRFDRVVVQWGNQQLPFNLCRRSL